MKESEIKEQKTVLEEINQNIENENEKEERGSSPDFKRPSTGRK
jgi:hypothetical protein